MSLEILLNRVGVRRKVQQSEKKFYVYVIYGPTMGPVYVGKGSGLRVLKHEDAAWKYLQENPDLPYEDWIASGEILNRSKTERLAAHLSYGNLKYRIDLYTNSEVRAFAREKKLIKAYGRAVTGRGILANLAGGGQGAWYSSNGGCPLGREVSAATRRRISDALTGRVPTPEHRDAIRNALIGRCLPKSTRDAMSKSRRGLTLSENHREAVSRGRLASPNIKRVAVRIHGVRYRSMLDAAQHSDYTYQQIVYALRSNREGFTRL